MRKLFIVGAIAFAAASAAQAQTVPLPPVPYAGQVSTPSIYSTLNAPGPNWDHWGMQSLARENGRVRRIVAKTTNQTEWNRARRAAIAINANKCDEAVAIAAGANDKRLMTGVRRACGAS